MGVTVTTTDCWVLEVRTVSTHKTDWTYTYINISAILLGAHAEEWCFYFYIYEIYIGTDRLCSCQLNSNLQSRGGDIQHISEDEVIL